MNDHSDSPPDLKCFVGASDYDCSRAFYAAIGFRVNWDTGSLAELDLGGARFLLQRYYQADWCNNSMLHMSVASAADWHARVQAAIDGGNFGAARVAPPKREDYGALVTYMWDPSGVLWHLAQRLE
ncbi:MAG: hypothetical protein AAF515_02455 [Pseudomonadota bacterium]